MKYFEQFFAVSEISLNSESNIGLFVQYFFIFTEQSREKNPSIDLIIKDKSWPKNLSNFPYWVISVVLLF